MFTLIVTVRGTVQRPQRHTPRCGKQREYSAFDMPSGNGTLRPPLRNLEKRNLCPLNGCFLNHTHTFPPKHVTAYKSHDLCLKRHSKAWMSQNTRVTVTSRNTLTTWLRSASSDVTLHQPWFGHVSSLAGAQVSGWAQVGWQGVWVGGSGAPPGKRGLPCPAPGSSGKPTVGLGERQPQPQLGVCRAELNHKGALPSHYGGRKGEEEEREECLPQQQPLQCSTAQGSGEAHYFVGELLSAILWTNTKQSEIMNRGFQIALIIKMRVRGGGGTFKLKNG